MIQCLSCSGFIPENSLRCPNCLRAGNLSNKISSQVKIATKIAGASIVSMTLMACYGAPPDDFMKVRKPYSKEESEIPQEDDKERDKEER
jgi:hypothetical protein